MQYADMTIAQIKERIEQLLFEWRRAPWDVWRAREVERLDKRLRQLEN